MESSNSQNTSFNKETDSTNKKEVKFAVVNSRTHTKIVLGIISLFILILGSAIGLYMTKLNQDLRQQASTGGYNYPGDACTDSGGSWVGNICTFGGSVTCDGPGTGIGGDPCAANGGYCTGTNVIRCHCGNAWVGGAAGHSCDDICEEAGLTCDTTCNPPDDEPTEPPPTNPPPTEPPTTITPTNTPTPTPTVTATPTPTPTTAPGECGFTPCETTSDCDTGLTCITASNNEKYCSKPEYATACAANPGLEACCNEPTPTTPVGPQCLDIAMYNTTNGNAVAMSGDSDLSLIPGESTVRFVCSNVFENNLPDGYFYAFRVYEPCGSANHLDPIEYVNEEGVNGFNYAITMPGDYMAQCSVCHTDTAGDTVCDWESLVPSECN